MSESQKQAEIIKSLKKLGIKIFDKVVTEEKAGRSVVYIGGEYFGIYDHERKTFVD